MPLNATNFVTNGHLIHQDLQQFVDLLTGVMSDQPVTISNTFRATGVATLGSDVIVAGAIKYGTAGTSTTTIYSPSAGQIAVTAALQVGGGLTFAPDNSYDIGATGTGRPRNIWVGSTLNAPQFVASASMTSPLYNVVNGNERLRLSPAAPQFFVQESTDLACQMWGAQGSGMTYNGYYDGTNWQRYNTANPEFGVSVELNGFFVRSAPAGSGPITAFTLGMQVDVNGSATLGRGLLLNQQRSPNQGGITMWTSGGSGGDTTLFSEGGPVYLWITAAAPTGQLIIQGSSGTGWRGISAGAIQSNAGGINANSVGGTTATGVAWSFAIAPNGSSLAGSNASGVLYALIGTTGDGYNSIWCMQSGLLFVNSANTVRIGNIDNNGNLSMIGNVAGVNMVASSGLLLGPSGATANIVYKAAAQMLVQNDLFIGGGLATGAQLAAGWPIAGDLNVRRGSQNVAYIFLANTGIYLGYDGTNFQLYGAGLQTWGGITVNTSHTPNGGGFLLETSNGNTTNIFAENGHTYFWASYAGAIYYFQASNNTAWGTLNAAAYTVVSQRKSKRDLVVLDQSAALEQVLDTRATPIAFSYLQTDTRHLGFVAEDMVQVVPEVVALDDDGDPCSINLGALVPVLWSAVRELSDRLERLENAA